MAAAWLLLIPLTLAPGPVDLQQQMRDWQVAGEFESQTECETSRDQVAAILLAKGESHTAERFRQGTCVQGEVVRQHRPR